MANPLKQLAGETAIYGLSTILARIINFLFVPFYTRLLTTASYGVVTEFMAYIAVLQVILVLGLETGCFRFANKDGVNPIAVYTNALATTFGISFSFLACMVIFATPIADALGYEGYQACIIYVGGILALDSTTAILFAKLRQEHKALKFAIFKTIKILTETAANIVLFFLFPAHCAKVAATIYPEISPELAISQLSSKDVWMLNFISATPDFSYVIFAILLSCIVCALLFIPDLFKLSFKFDGKLLKKMLAYSIPLMIAALPGIVNDFLDRILFRFLDTNAEAWRSSLGIFQAAVKISVIMSLFIQMFRFAAEPFFFQRVKDKNSKELYAIVMEFFTAFCGLIFLGVILYIDVFSLILGRDFRSGIGVVPIMLLSYMLLGMLFNVSMWYKLSEKTNMAIYITLAGLAVTIVINVLFMPRYSYWAAAFGHLGSYLVMFIISALLGAHYYPIPYKWGKILFFFLLMGAFFGISLGLDKILFGGGVTIGKTETWKVICELLAHTAILGLYAITCWKVLKPRYRLMLKEANGK
ncbi:MAG: oligosaccharide flippase family protein [Bacteroidales bacterium]